MVFRSALPGPDLGSGKVGNRVGNGIRNNVPPLLTKAIAEHIRYCFFIGKSCVR